MSSHRNKPGTRLPNTPTLRLSPAEAAATDSSDSSCLPDSGPTIAPPPMPARIGRYEIVREVGRGGMGVVYEAYDPSIQRRVAIKMLLGAGQADPETWARFGVEARVLAQLQHPHIVQLYEFGNEAGQLYFTLEFIAGGSLKARGKDLSPRSAATLIVPLAEAIHVAHQKGIVHRDLKPANVLLTAAGQPKIVDFGLAKLARNADPNGWSLTRAGDVLGTPQYMAPEQANGLHDLIGPATDVYALGAILYELLTGQPPFDAGEAIQTVQAVIDQEPRPPRRLNPTVPRDLETICLKCLHKEPWQRYGSGADLAADLRRFLAGESIRARPLGAAKRSWRWARRHPAVAALLLLVALVTVLGFAGIVWQWRRAEDRALAEIAAREEANRQQEQADQQRTAAENALYFSRILQAQREFEANRVSQTLHLLDLCRPRPGDIDRRGWEWHYLKRLCHAELRTFTADTVWVWGVAFSPDGRLLATASGSPFGDSSRTPGQLILWDAATPQKLAALDGHQGSVRGVAFSPDGRSMLSVSLDGTARLWDVASRRQLWQTPCRETGPVAFTPDSKEVIIAASKDSSQRIDCASGRGTDLQGRLVGIDRDGRIALYRNQEKACAFVDGPDGAAPSQVPLGKGTPQAWSADGRTLAVFAGNSLQLQDVMTGDARILNRPPGDIYALAFSPDGACLATAGADRIVRIWNVATGETVHEYHGHAVPIRGMAFQADGARLASCDQLGQVKLWDVTRDPCQRRFPVDVPADRIGALGFRTRGGHSELLIDAHQWTESWNVVTAGFQGRQKGPMSGPTMYPRYDRAFSKDGQRFAAPVMADQRQVKVWDAATGRELLTLDGPSLPVRCITFSADNRRIATAAFRTENRNGARAHFLDPATVWDGATGRRVTVLKPAAWAVALSADGRHAATVGPGGTDAWVRLHDAETGEELWGRPGHHGFPVNLTFSLDGKRLASVGFHDGLVKLWNVANGESQEFEQSPLGRRELAAVTFTPDGKRLAAVGYDGDVHLWDTATGSAVLTLRCPAGPRPDDYGLCPHIIFSADGWLASNDWKSAVSVWDGRPVEAETEKTSPRLVQERIRAWHQTQAEIYERAGRAFAAGFHRERLRALDRRSPSPD